MLVFEFKTYGKTNQYHPRRLRHSRRQYSCDLFRRLNFRQRQRRHHRRRQRTTAFLPAKVTTLFIDTVLNFSIGTDLFFLAEGLSFEALRINSTANGTLLQFAATGEFFAQVFGTNNAITSLDFVAVAR